MIKSWADEHRGVRVIPSSFGDQATIHYNGLLAKSGADAVYLHCGYGEKNSWHNISTQKMIPSYSGWETTVPMKDSSLNFCFKDGADNWDNNNSVNWMVRS